MELQSGAETENVVMQSGATATGNGTAAKCIGWRGAFDTLTLQVKGITSATITFEATVNGTDWVAVPVTNVGSGAAATTTTADGLFRVTVKGVRLLRARISAYSSGTISVEGYLAA